MTKSSRKNWPFQVRFLRLPEVLDRVGLSKMTIYRKELKGTFPRRRKIGVKAVAWIESEIDDWCTGRADGEPQEGGVQ